MNIAIEYWILIKFRNLFRKIQFENFFKMNNKFKILPAFQVCWLSLFHTLSRKLPHIDRFVRKPDTGK